MTISKPEKGKRLLPLSKQKKKLDLGSINPRDIPDFRNNPNVAPESFLVKPSYQEEQQSAHSVNKSEKTEKTPSPSLRKKRNAHVSDIVTKPEADVYLTEEGPNKF